MRKADVWSAVGLGIFAAGVGFADQPQGFGVMDEEILNIGPCSMRARQATDAAFFTDNCDVLLVNPSMGVLSVGADVHLPSGVLITKVTIHYKDADTSDPSVALARIGTTGGFSAIFNQNLDVFSGGDRTQTIVVDPPEVVDNETNNYVFLMILGYDLGASHGFYRAAIHFRRQVRPAPSVATFNDVPTSHPFFQFVEALVASGVTAGCGMDIYCPDAPVTRGQMAVFLAKALGLHWPN